jgi:DNA topoisomerase-1
MEGATLRDAELRYVDDRAPGITRRRRGTGFAYFGPDGRLLGDEETLRRVRKLAIPPAYRDVWICPVADGHMQATGRDARGRKQYRYHARWREVRDEAKYQRTIAFARALPRIRQRVAGDLQEYGHSRDKVAATVVRLLDLTLARIGNEGYVRDNGSYGLTTLRVKHARVKGSRLQLRFRGKSGVEHTIAVSDRRLASIVRRCRDLPGQELFVYLEDAGSPTPLRSDDINGYVRKAAGADFTAKDFRTWHGTVLCAKELSDVGPIDGTMNRRKAVNRALEDVARRLRNTPAVCRSCYVHPAVVDAFMADGVLRLPRVRTKPSDDGGLDVDERRVLRLLERLSATGVKERDAAA